ncbi:MAG: ribose 5-phosphate isomerase B [Ignavibacteriales bacterium]|nr:ribose 5-phosphate isomerase B [Ignavibacteriales bacterium]
MNVVLTEGSAAPAVTSFVDSVSIHTPPKSKERRIVIALGADHGGYSLKESVKKYLLEEGYTVADVGTHSEQSCDYPDFAYAVAALVSSGQASQGIMIDAVGMASAIVCNKVPGIRAVAAYNEFVARSSREHNDANILTLGGRVMGVESAKSVLAAWLATWFGGGRHQARVRKIQEIEEKFSKRGSH